MDVNVYGILPLELYRVGTGEAFREQGMRYADGQWEDPLPGGMTRQVRFWIDDIWMIASLQIQALPDEQLGHLADLAHKVAVLNKGKIVEQGETANVLQNPQHPYTKALLACRPAAMRFR